MAAARSTEEWVANLSEADVMMPTRGRRQRLSVIDAQMTRINQVCVSVPLHEPLLRVTRSEYVIEAFVTRSNR
jgi:hypothetical protein